MADQPTERLDSAEEFQRKIGQVHRLMQEAKYVVVFTGAGVSTASNIDDFRGDKGIERTNRTAAWVGQQEHKIDFCMPSLAHMVIKRMVDKGIVKFVCTSNHDNLHYKSGVDEDHLSEMFGNAYIEKCLKCDKRWRRKVIVPNISRKCRACGGRLQKTGTRMNEMTPAEPLAVSTAEARKCDLAITLGSSLTVSPFCDLPPMARHLVVCNLQPTPLDDRADVMLHAKTDDTMRELGKLFGIDGLDHTYEQEFAAALTQADGRWSITLSGGAEDEPVTCFAEAIATYGTQRVVFDADNQWTATLPGYTGESEVRVECTPREEFGTTAAPVVLALSSANPAARATFTLRTSYTL